MRYKLFEADSLSELHEAVNHWLSGREEFDGRFGRVVKQQLVVSPRGEGPPTFYLSVFYQQPQE